MKPFLKLEGVTHEYPGGVTAIRDVDLEIGEGEVVAVLGSNGSGKTTLVKHFNGLLKPTSGRVEVAGLDTRKERVAKLSGYVGYVFQNPNHQLFLSSVREELRYGCLNLRLDETEIEKRVQRAVQWFQLHDVLDANPFDLNPSRRKEVAMASVVAVSPKAIVLDEPTTGQDHAGCARVLQLVRNLRDQGQTVILVTHDMQLVGELNCRVIVMNQGRKIADDRADQIFRDRGLMKKAGIEPPQVTLLSDQLPYLDSDRMYLTIDSIVDWFEKTVKEDNRIAAKG